MAAIVHMKSKDFLAAVQSRVARVAVGASTVRGRGHAGTVRAARRFFRTLDLKKFSVSPLDFQTALNRETGSLKRKLPKEGRKGSGTYSFFDPPIAASIPSPSCLADLVTFPAG